MGDDAYNRNQGRLHINLEGTGCENGGQGASDTLRRLRQPIPARKKHAGKNFRFNTGNWCSNRKCPSAGKQVGTKVLRESVSDGKTKIGALPAEKPRRSVQLQLRRFRHNIDIILHFLDTVRDRQE